MPPPQQYTQQYQAPPKRDGCMWAVILLAVLVPIIPLLTCGGCVVMSMISAAVDGDGSGGSGDQEQPSEAPMEPEPFDTDATVAWVMAKRFVKDSLKSPSSANFGYQLSSDTVTRTGPHSFEVRGWVEAQNSFGAQLRSRFHVKLHCDESGENWKLDEPVLLVEP